MVEPSEWSKLFENYCETPWPVSKFWIGFQKKIGFHHCELLLISSQNERTPGQEIFGLEIRLQPNRFDVIWRAEKNCWLRALTLQLSEIMFLFKNLNGIKVVDGRQPRGGFCANDRSRNCNRRKADFLKYGHIWIELICCKKISERFLKCCLWKVVVRFCEIFPDAQTPANWTNLKNTLSVYRKHLKFCDGNDQLLDKKDMNTCGELWKMYATNSIL